MTPCLAMMARHVYRLSDGDLTKRYYAELEKRGPVGVVALNLFRAQKCSARAKVYRGGIRGKGSFKSMAYDRKRWSMDNLVEVLKDHAAALNISFGWKQDHGTVFDGQASWVLYVDLPQGQVSFHSPDRGLGPDYPGEFCGEHRSADRILEFCDSVFALEEGRTDGSA